MKSGPHIIRRGDEKINEEEMLYGDSTLSEVFDFKLLKGNPKKALVNPRSLILSESYANKYFGTADRLVRSLSSTATLPVTS